ncbi:hypothetical protein ACRAKI_19535 [Saccharothrix isguenensis]
MERDRAAKPCSVDFALRCVAVAVTGKWPALDRDRVAVTAEAAILLAVSNMVLPLHPAERVAEQTSALLSKFVERPAVERPT